MFRGKVGRWTETDLTQLTQQQCSVWVCAHMAVYMLKTKRWRCTYFNETAHSIMPADREDHTHTHVLYTNTITQPWLQTDLRVFGDPVPQHVEDSVGCSSADDEVFVTSSLRVCKNCRKNPDFHSFQQNARKEVLLQTKSFPQEYLYVKASVWRVNFIGGLDNLVN